MSDTPTLASRFKFDEENQIVIIDGHKVSAEFIDWFTTPSQPGRWYRIIAVNETITIEQKDETP